MKTKKLQRIHHDITVGVGANIRRFREQADMSQSDVGAQLGLTFQQVQKYENGTNRANAAVLFHMSRIFAVPVEQFFHGMTMDNQRVDVRPLAHAKPSDIHMAQRLARLPAGTKAAVVKIVDVLEVTGRA